MTGTQAGDGEASEQAGAVVDERWRPLPPGDSGPSEYDVLLLTDLISHEETQRVRALLSEIRRRASVVQGEDGEALGELERAVRAILDRRRVAVRRRMIGDKEREPFRRQVLSSLSERRATPSQLAERLSGRVETISRLLRGLEEEGLVSWEEDPKDLRKRIYSLTEVGVSAANDHHAFGMPEDEGMGGLTRSEIQERLHSLIDLAVSERRHHNGLQSGSRRLEVAIREAEKYNELPIEINARRELLNTLRQAARWDEMDGHFAKLEEVVQGKRPIERASVVLAASAHLEYERGRYKTPGSTDSLDRRARRLLTAATLYEQLTVSPQPHEEPWDLRHAWSRAGLADNLREQTRFGSALQQADIARTYFDRHGDAYGQTWSLFLRGFCQRLRGNYVDAVDSLTRAFDLAVSNKFERFRADSLMQVGEALRCLGLVDDAEERLLESLGLATERNILVTKGFAASALGAIAYSREQLDHGTAYFVDAHRSFVDSGHGDGLALNCRRMAAAGRSTSRYEDLLPESPQQLLHSAIDHYQKIASPAGYAACQVGLGRMALVSGKSPEVACNKIVQILLQPKQWYLITLDPWLPFMLKDFSSVANHDDLDVEVYELLGAIEARKSEMTDVDGLADHRSIQQILSTTSEVLKHDWLGIEMAFEPRKDADELREAA